MASDTASCGLPLSGVTVLDLSRLLPGAYCTLALADLGAEVVKVEDPRGGDMVRSMPPIAGGASVYFQVLNRNKRSLTLDLRAPEAARILDEVAARADVVVESFRPHTAKRLKVSAADLRARYPRLVHCSISGFGQTGPYAERPAHDINFVALAGLFEVDQPRGQEPRHVPRMLVADIGGALHALAGILAGLFWRERSGQGSTVDISMHEAAFAWLTFPAARALVGGGELDPSELPITGREACYNIYQTADGRYVALGAIEPKFWATFCERAGRADLIPLQYSTGEKQERLFEETARLFRSETRDAWLSRFQGVDVCLAPVNSVAEALADPHVAARGAIARHAGSRFILTPIRICSSLPDDPDADTPARPSLVGAPELGADTDAVLAAAGIAEEKRRELRERGVI